MESLTSERERSTSPVFDVSGNVEKESLGSRLGSHVT